MSYSFKIVMVGDSGAGKSSIIHTYRYGSLEANPDKTIGMDLAIEQININNHTVKLEIWDLSGDIRYRAVIRKYYEKANGVFIVFDASANDLSSVSDWITEIHRACGRTIPIIVLANKIDLCTEPIKYKFDFLCIQTSAKTGYNIKTAISQISKILITKFLSGYNNLKPPKPIDIEEKKDSSRSCPRETCNCIIL